MNSGVVQPQQWAQPSDEERSPEGGYANPIAHGQAQGQRQAQGQGLAQPAPAGHTIAGPNAAAGAGVTSGQGIRYRQEDDSGAPAQLEGPPGQEKPRFLKDFSEYTSIHGLPHAFSPSLPFVHRACWAIMFVVSMVILGYLVIDQVIKYREWPATTEITTSPETQLTFPAVSFCNNADVAKSKVIGTPFAPLLLGNEPNPYSLDEFKDVGFTLDDMLIYGTFKTIDFDENAFVEFQDPLYGNCYTFNAPGTFLNNDDEGRWAEYPLKANKEGAGFGLELLLDANLPEYATASLLSDYQPPDAGGIRIAIHDPSVPPSMAAEGFLVAPGHLTEISVEQVVTKRLEKDWGSCPKDWKKNGDPAGYSTKSCLDKCQAELLYAECGCSSPGVGPTDDGNACAPRGSTNTSLTDCIIGIYDALAAGNVDCGCEYPCSELTYPIVTSNSAPSPSSATATQYASDILSLFGDVVDPTYLQENYVTIRVFFRDLKTTRYTSVKATSVETVIGTVGGFAGLLVGMSCLSVLECIEFWCTCGRSRKRRAQAANSAVPPVQMGQPDGVDPRTMFYSSRPANRVAYHRDGPNSGQRPGASAPSLP